MEAASKCDDCPSLYEAALCATGQDRVKLLRNLWEQLHDNESCGVYPSVGQCLVKAYLSDGDYSKADSILEKLNYTCRLSNQLIEAAQASHDLEVIVKNNDSFDPYLVLDELMTNNELEALQDVFLDIDNPYWKERNYSGGSNPSPYYSYVVKLGLATGVIGNVIQRLQAALEGSYPIKRAQYAEIWAHNRPGDTGHQFHLDSDNEGDTEIIRHPICSCVVYLSMGGPTVIMQQRLASKSLSSRAWIIPPKTGRAACFDGSLLHGVLPSHSEHRRVSLMIAFWRNIRIREGTAAAQPFPDDASWAQKLMRPMELEHTTPTRLQPITVKPAYQTVIPRGQPWKRGLPQYEQIFQEL